MPSLLELPGTPWSGLWKHSPRSGLFHGSLAMCLLILALTPTARADEAILLDGSRLHGELRFRNERFDFFPDAQANPLPWAQIDRVEPAQKSSLPPTLPACWLATVINGDQFGCQLLEIESNAFIADSSWFQGLRIRRNAVRAMARPQGWAPWLRQDFLKEARGWKETRADGDGSPLPGMTGLELGTSNKSLHFTPETPLPFGQISLRMKEAGATNGTRWQLQLGIDGDRGFQTVKIQFGGPGPCELRAPGHPVLRQQVKDVASPFLLQFEVSDASVRLIVNGSLASWIERGFRDARLRSLLLEPETPLVGNSPAKLNLQEFAIARRLEPLQRPPRHPELDEVWLESGDQIFGNFRLVDSQYLELASSRETRRIPRNLVRGLFPRQSAIRDVQLPAPWQLTLRDPSGCESSRLTGLIRTWGEREIVMIHPLLGELKLPRSQVKSLAQAELASAAGQPRPSKAIKP